jgi:hypothetical protein
VLAYASGLGEDEDEAWAGCAEAESLVWLAVARGTSLQDVARAVIACTRLGAERHPARLMLEEVLDAIEEVIDGEGDLAAARESAAALDRNDAGEQLYRDAPRPDWLAAIEAARLVAESLEALRAAALRTQQERTAMLGMSALAPTRLVAGSIAGAPEVSLATAWCAEALTLAVAALSGPRPDPIAPAEAQSRGVELFRVAVAESG